MENKKLTEKRYWDLSYQKVDKNSFMPNYNNLNQQIELEILETFSMFMKGDSVLEIGAGDSDFLIYLSNKYKGKSFSGMDYSDIGCVKLKERADNLKLELNVINQDLFESKSKYYDTFSMVYSMGVVEHFENLGDVLNKTKRYCKPDGFHIATIPNMSGIYGWITKLLDKELYDIHNPHDLSSFVSGHEDANLEIILADYYGFFNAGTLTSIKHFKESKIFFKILYKAFKFVTKTLSIINKHLFKIPKSAYFSPHIVVVSKRKD